MLKAYDYSDTPVSSWTLSGTGPLYLQLKQFVADKIHDGSLKPGAGLPSERELAELCEVSRVTVRKAVQALVKEGLVVQKRGSGTVVAPPVSRVEQSLTGLTSFSEDMTRRGQKASSVWLDRGVFPASPDEMMILGVPSSTNVARVSRLRMADGVPLAIERASLSTLYLPDPDEIIDSLYKVLALRSYRPVRATQRISARQISAEDADLLGVEAGIAGLKIERIAYLATGEVIEFTRSIYRGDTYDFVAELTLNSEG